MQLRHKKCSSVASNGRLEGHEADKTSVARSRKDCKRSHNADIETDMVSVLVC
jgi:hypothetical protein